jgi:dimethylglycine dehydrogenase
MVLDADDAPATPGASVMRDGRVIGTVTSGGWGHRVGSNIAYAFVDFEHAQTGSQFSIDVLGHFVQAEVVEPALYDPKLERVRA